MLTECQLSELVAHWSTWSTSQCDTADAVWSRSLVSRKAEVCPSGGIVYADVADCGSRWSAGELRWCRVVGTLCASAERSFAGTWVRQLGRWSPPRRVAGWSTSPHSSLPYPSPIPGQKSRTVACPPCCRIRP